MVNDCFINQIPTWLSQLNYMLLLRGLKISHYQQCTLGSSSIYEIKNMCFWIILDQWDNNFTVKLVNIDHKSVCIIFSLRNENYQNIK